jgi:phosphoribosylformylglycinamidine synthase
MAFAGGIGMDLDLGKVPVEAITSLDRVLFSESQSRIVLTIPAAKLAQARALLGSIPHAVIGQTIAEPVLKVRGQGAAFTARLSDLKAAWQGTLRVMEI